MSVYYVLSTELYHHGILGMKWGVRRTPEELGHLGNTKTEFTVGKSVGAKSKTYYVLDKETGKYYSIIEGQRIQDAHVFAGSGTSSPLRGEVAEGLAERYGGTPKDWQHCKGTAELNYFGEERKAEIHWFQAKNAGKHRFKVKKWLD